MNMAGRPVRTTKAPTKASRSQSRTVRERRLGWPVAAPLRPDLRRPSRGLSDPARALEFLDPSVRRSTSADSQASIEGTDGRSLIAADKAVLMPRHRRSPLRSTIRSASPTYGLGLRAASGTGECCSSPGPQLAASAIAGRARERPCLGVTAAPSHGMALPVRDLSRHEPPLAVGSVQAAGVDLS